VRDRGGEGGHDEEVAPLHVIVGYAGPAYREAKSKYRSDVERDLHAYLRATLAGSMRTDQNRFNVLGEFGAIYLSLDRETPVRELERTYRKLAATANPEDISVPRILMTLEMSLARVADLRDPDECEEWGITPAAVTGDDLAPCQAAARDIRRTHEALRWNSAAGSGENIALFFDRMWPESSVKLVSVNEMVLPWSRP
jgi:RES domain-containing protein